MRLKIELVELILHPDHVHTLSDRRQRVLGILPNAVAYHPAQAVVKQKRRHMHNS